MSRLFSPPKAARKKGSDKVQKNTQEHTIDIINSESPDASIKDVITCLDSLKNPDEKERILASYIRKLIDWTEGLKNERGHAATKTVIGIVSNKLVESKYNTPEEAERLRKKLYNILGESLKDKETS